MRSFTIFFLIFLAVFQLAFWNGATAGTIYVDATADTASANGTLANPFPGIDMGCLAASSGDTIMVFPGTYGNANIPAPRPDSLTIISSDGAAATIVDGAQTTDLSFGIVIRAGRGWTVDGFTFINVGAPTPGSGYACGVYNDNRDSGNADTTVVNVVRNCVFMEPQIRGVWVQKGTKVLIEHNYFIRAGANGVLSYGFTNFFNNTVVSTDTLSPYGDNSGVYQAGDGGSNGIMKVTNNIFYDNYVGIIRSGDCFLYSSYNLYYGNVTDTVSVTADYGNNVMDDPMFFDEANDDYRLLAESPAIDAGTDVGLPYKGAAPEIGAYEGIGILLTIYVNANADTASANGTQAFPFPGIDMACMSAVDGATIMVAPGTYGNCYIDPPRPSNLTIQSSEGAATTIIDGAQTENLSFGIVIRAGSGWTVDGFTFINVGATTPGSGYACGVYNDNRVSGAADTSVVSVVRNCMFMEPMLRGVWVQKGTKALIEHNYFIRAGANGVLSYGFTNFYNNTVVSTDTLSPYGDNSGVYQAGDGGSNGIMKVKNNIFYDNYVGIIRSGDSFLYSSYNLYYANVTDTIGVTADFGNNVMDDPMFVNTAGDDYRLLAESPAIDAGTDVGLPYVGAAPEMGAYEGIGILLTIYVDATADTATANGTQAHPYPGIDMACMSAIDGATIMVSPGTYGNCYIDPPRPSNLIIQSTDGAEMTIVDGSQTQNLSFGIVIRAGSGWTVDGFTFINVGATTPGSGYACGVYNDNRVSGAADTSVVSVVRNCVFMEPMLRGVWVQKGTKALIEHNYFIRAGANGVLSYGFTNFFNNTVASTDTLSPYGDNSGVYEAGDGGSNGIMKVKNNIFFDNYVGVIRAGDSFLYSSYNLYYQNVIDEIAVTANNGHNVMDDPKFVDATNDDYQLYATSPAIDAGTDVGLPYVGAAPDMGAYEGTGVLGIETPAATPTRFSLKQNYPNPFNPTTTIKYEIARLVDVKLLVYNSLGQQVKVLVNKRQPAGYYEAKWDGKNYAGEQVGSGVYFYRLKAGDFEQTAKMLLLK